MSISRSATRRWPERGPAPCGIRTKQGAAHGYIGVRGLNIQVGTVSTPVTAPVIGRARLRPDNANSASGASRLLAQTITTARAGGVTGQILGRPTRRSTAGRSSGPRSAIGSGSLRDCADDLVSQDPRSPASTPGAWRRSGTSTQSGSTTTPLPAGLLGQRRRGRPSRVHRVRLTTQTRATSPAGSSCAESDDSNPWHLTAANKANCSLGTATTRSSPTPPSPWSRPTHATVTTGSRSW